MAILLYAICSWRQTILKTIYLDFWFVVVVYTPRFKWEEGKEKLSKNFDLGELSDKITSAAGLVVGQN